MDAKVRRYVVFLPESLHPPRHIIGYYDAVLADIAEDMAKKDTPELADWHDQYHTIAVQIV